MEAPAARLLGAIRKPLPRSRRRAAGPSHLAPPCAPARVARAAGFAIAVWPGALRWHPRLRRHGSRHCRHLSRLAADAADAVDATEQREGVHHQWRSAEGGSASAVATVAAVAPGARGATVRAHPVPQCSPPPKPPPLAPSLPPPLRRATSPAAAPGHTWSPPPPAPPPSPPLARASAAAAPRADGPTSGRVRRLAGPGRAPRGGSQAAAAVSPRSRRAQSSADRRAETGGCGQQVGLD